MIVQLYKMAVAPDREADFLAIAGELADFLRRSSGCDGILVAKTTTGDFLFLEQWQDEEARKAAGLTVDAALFTALNQALAAKPEAISAEVIAS